MLFFGFQNLLYIQSQAIFHNPSDIKSQVHETKCQSIMFRPEDIERAKSSSHYLQTLGYQPNALSLIQALQSKEEAVRAESAFLLGYNQETFAQEALKQSLKDSSARVRVEAALALARLGKKEEALVVLRTELLGEMFEDAPLRAARSLALLGDPSGHTRVMEALRSTFPSDRMEAIAVISVFLPYKGQVIDGQIIDPIASLSQAVSDPDSLLRRDAIYAIAQIEDPRSRSILENALNDPDPETKESAKHLLEQLPQNNSCTQINRE